MNRHVTDVLGDIPETSSEKKDGLPRKIWQRIKSKIESLGHKPATTAEKEEREGGEKG